MLILDQIVTALKTVIALINIPLLIIAIYATIVRVVEAVNQLSTQPDVKSTWAKIKQTIKNFASVETYKK